MTQINNSLFGLTSLVAILTLGLASPVFAEEPFICDSFIDNQTIDAEVIVPAGETCEFYEVTVNGNVTIQKDADFKISSSTTINGNLSANQANEINITELNMYGNISIVNSGNVDIQQATVIFGNVLFKGNNFVDLFEQAIFGNVIIAQNEGVDAADVGIHGNLLLLGNTLVNANTDSDFYLTVFENATCLQNEVFNGVVNALAKNNGCPLPS